MSFAKFTRGVLLLLVGLAAVPSGRAQTYTVLYSFTGGADGAFPFAGVIRDSAGNLYGTTAGEQTGTVFKLSPKGKFKLLHSFAVEGFYDWPFSGLVRDSAGNLYGTIYYGGTFNLGMVYKVDKKDNFSALYNFSLPWFNVGSGPLGSLILDSAGNLYGAGGGGNGKCNGGNPYCGVVFKLDPSGNETVLHAFSRPRNGDYPEAGLVRDAAGNLYGTTNGGGHGGNGIVFKLDPAGNETVLHTFKATKGIPDGAKPQAGLIQDAAGNLYGTTPSGGNHGCGSFGDSSCGVVFKVDVNGNETLLYTFTGGADGGQPRGPLVMDSAGNLYGTAGWGSTGGGVVFKLAPSGTETVLYTFTGGTDGAGPIGGLTMDSAGNLYGTTLGGGNLNDCTSGGGAGCGVVFKITP